MSPLFDGNTRCKVLQSGKVWPFWHTFGKAVKSFKGNALAYFVTASVPKKRVVITFAAEESERRETVCEKSREHSKQLRRRTSKSADQE